MHALQKSLIVLLDLRHIADAADIPGNQIRHLIVDHGDVMNQIVIQIVVFNPA